jgi:hypothetical protein
MIAAGRLRFGLDRVDDVGRGALHAPGSSPPRASLAIAVRAPAITVPAHATASQTAQT